MNRNFTINLETFVSPNREFARKLPNLNHIINSKDSAIKACICVTLAKKYGKLDILFPLNFRKTNLEAIS